MSARRKQWTDMLAARHVQPPLFDPPVQPKRRRSGTCKKPSVPEKDIQKMILDALSIHPMVARVERINVMAGRLMGKDGKPSRFLRSCKAGRVDIDGISIDGRVIAIEVKRPSTRNHVSVEQKEYLAVVQRAGGLAGVACSVDEALAIVEGAPTCTKGKT
jgi:hypothetical protein